MIRLHISLHSPIEKLSSASCGWHLLMNETSNWSRWKKDIYSGVTYRRFMYLLSAMYVDWELPHSSLSSVLNITSTYTSSMQELIMQEIQQKWHKCCFRCKKNTWHVESNFILQPPNYLIIIVNRFIYINNNVTKYMFSITMDMTIVFCLDKFSPKATTDHQGPSMYSGHYTNLIKRSEKNSFATTAKLCSLKLLKPNNSSSAYVVMYKLIT